MPETPRPRRRGPHWSRFVFFALLFAGVWYWGGQDPDPPSAPAPTPPAAQRPTPPVLADAATPRVPLPAGKAPPPPLVDTDLALPCSYTLDVAVLDRWGLPLPDANVFAAPPEGAFCRLPEPTDPRGHARLVCRGRVPRLPLWLAVMANGVTEPLRQIELVDDTTVAVTLIARGEQLDSERLEQLLEDGTTAEQLSREVDRMRRERERDDKLGRRGKLVRRDALDILCGRGIGMFSAMNCNACHQPSRTAAFTALQWAPDLHPRTGSQSPFADLRLRPPGNEELRARRRPLHAPMASEWAQRLIRDRHGDVTTVRGRVLTDAGHTVPFVPVAWLDDGALRVRTFTDENGEWQLRLPAGVACTLVTRAGQHGRAETQVVGMRDDDALCDLRLLPPLLLRGNARDPNGDPLGQWNVEFDGGARLAALATTGNDGAFAFADLAGPGRMLLWPVDGDLRLPVHQSPLALPNGPPAELRLRADAPTRARLRVRAGLPHGYERARVELRLLQVDTGRGAHLVRTGNDDAFELEGLAAGPYRGEIGAQGLGWQSFGPVWLDGRGLYDQGTYAFVRPGQLRVLAPAGAPSPLAGPFALWRRTPLVDIAVDPRRLGEDLLELPPGDYVFAFGDGAARHAVACTVASAAETVFELPAR